MKLDVLLELADVQLLDPGSRNNSASRITYRSPVLPCRTENSNYFLHLPLCCFCCLACRVKWSQPPPACSTRICPIRELLCCSQIFMSYVCITHSGCVALEYRTSLLKTKSQCFEIMALCQFLKQQNLSELTLTGKKRCNAALSVRQRRRRHADFCESKQQMLWGCIVHPTW